MVLTVCKTPKDGEADTIGAVIAQVHKDPSALFICSCYCTRMR